MQAPKKRKSQSDPSGPNQNGETTNSVLMHLSNTPSSASPAPQCPFGKIKTRDLVRIPEDINLLFALQVDPRHAPYYDTKPSHLKKMNEVYRLLVDAGSKVEDGIVKAKSLLSTGTNAAMLRHALGIYLTHSKDAQARKIIVPPLKFHASMVAQQPPKSRTLAATQEVTQPIVPGEVVTPDNLTGPAIISYWREDYDYNDHHVHWHMVFPGTGVYVDGKNVKVIDRQGELFLYMHSQMVARYETEGLCWDLPLVRPWNQYDDFLDFSYLPVPGLSEYYGGYPAFSSWYALRNPAIPTQTEDAPEARSTLETWRDNIYEGIKLGYMKTRTTNGTEGKYALTADNCHDVVGTIIEAESAALQILPDGSSYDEKTYGNLHNFGHDKFAEISYHNYPTKNSPYGLMISNFGSPRDPAFWPWHKHIQYFGRLCSAKYPQDITEYRAQVALSSLVIRPKNNPSAKGITTFMTPPATNLMESKAKLDHEPYEWSVDVTSTLATAPSPQSPQVITLRFFIVAKKLVEDYHCWIEMDKTTFTLTSQTATVVRADTDSSVARKMGKYSELDPQYSSPWCRCGWPQNMMLPAGKVSGMDYVSFCIATNDSIDPDSASSALSYCGAIQKDRKYPDPRGMGYPFNRVWTQQVVDEKTNREIIQIIQDQQNFPFLVSGSFQIFRTTKPYLKSDNDVQPTTVTWYNTIKDYFLPTDVLCMKNEYGYDLSNYYDVLLHAAAILDATSNKRMPLQMPPFTQENPDPNHPMWTDLMCSNFRAWMENGCPEGKDGPPPPPVTTATWDDPIKSYFLPSDVTCMAGKFNLADHQSVKENAAVILQVTTNKSMPLQMAPYTQQNPDPKHPLWSPEMLSTFKAWMDAGCP